MIFKVIGSAMIIFSSGLIGYVISKDCSKRPVQLRELQNMIQMLENEIRFLASYIPDAFLKIAESMNSPVAKFFISTSEILNNNSSGLNASEAWEKSVLDNMSRTALTKEDRDVLFNFGKMIGNSDLEGQIKNIRFALGQLNLQEKKAEENRKKNEILYKALGLLGGIAAVLILI